MESNWHLDHPKWIKFSTLNLRPGNAANVVGFESVILPMLLNSTVLKYIGIETMKHRQCHSFFAVPKIRKIDYMCGTSKNPEQKTTLVINMII